MGSEPPTFVRTPRPAPTPFPFTGWICHKARPSQAPTAYVRALNLQVRRSDQSYRRLDDYPFHTRSEGGFNAVLLSNVIGPDGSADVSVDDGCCTRVLCAEYRLADPREEVEQLVAAARLLRFHLYPGYEHLRGPRTGDVGVVRVTDGVRFRSPPSS